MVDFTGEFCSECNDKIDNSSDVVVCPICGTPYHRHCYGKAGRCKYEESHKKGYVWKRKVSFKKKEQELKCPSCLHNNPNNAICCEKCNFSFAEKKVSNKQLEEASELKNRFSEEISKNFVKLSVGSDLFSSNAFNSKEKLKGIELKVWVKCIQENVMYYISEFKKIELTNKCRFNFSAFFFAGFWFLYRKCGRIGRIMLMFMGISSFAAEFIQVIFGSRISEEILNRIPNNIKLPERVLVFYNELFNLPLWQVFLYFLPGLAASFYFAAMVFCGKFANKWYMKECEKKIKKIQRDSKNSKEIDEKFLIFGGVTSSVIWLVASLTTFLLLLLCFF
ncbi:MAG: hypothetical protein LBF33_03375 [Oscillospiraceae bacterium]|jgi:hypothetical protein|nr:hypothetical protein [Oscillospiraceae bacterium]